MTVTMTILIPLPCSLVVCILSTLCGIPWVLSSHLVGHKLVTHKLLIVLDAVVQ